MSSVSILVDHPPGRALVVGAAACRAQPAEVLQRLGFGCAAADDPYAAMAELARRPDGYRALILSLQGLYREELGLVATVKRRYAGVEVWLTDIDGCQAALVEAVRLGADGLLSADGLHRLGVPPAPHAAQGTPPAPVAVRPAEPPRAEPAAPTAAKTESAAATARPRRTSAATGLAADLATKSSPGASDAGGSPEPGVERPTRRPPLGGAPDDAPRGKPAASFAAVLAAKTADHAATPATPAPARRVEREVVDDEPEEGGMGEAVLTADELRALLQDPSPASYTGDGV